jgi:hypothetical protein
MDETAVCSIWPGGLCKLMTLRNCIIIGVRIWDSLFSDYRRSIEGTVPSAAGSYVFETDLFQKEVNAET